MRRAGRDRILDHDPAVMSDCASTVERDARARRRASSAPGVFCSTGVTVRSIAISGLKRCDRAAAPRGFARSPRVAPRLHERGSASRGAPATGTRVRRGTLLAGHVDRSRVSPRRRSSMRPVTGVVSKAALNFSDREHAPCVRRRRVPVPATLPAQRAAHHARHVLPPLRPRRAR